MPDSVKFNNLRIEGWRQFDNIDIEFHPRLTVLTGANGAGKTTLLRVLYVVLRIDKWN
jgi:predicted ATPase